MDDCDNFSEDNVVFCSMPQPFTPYNNKIFLKVNS